MSETVSIASMASQAANYHGISEFDELPCNEAIAIMLVYLAEKLDSLKSPEAS